MNKNIKDCISKIKWLNVVEIMLFVGFVIFVCVMFARVCNNANAFYQAEMARPENADLELLVRIGRSERISSAFIALAILTVQLLALSIVGLFVNRNENRIDKIFTSIFAVIAGAFLIVWLASLPNASSDNYFVWSLDYAFKSAVGVRVY